MKNSTGNPKPRCAAVRRTTTETRIALSLKLDGTGAASVSTGIPFLDHMLTLFARHAVMDLDLSCQGDLAVDGHHTVEDCGLALGQAFREALGGKEGIRRYGTGFDPRNPLGGETVEPVARRYTAGFDPRNPLCAEAHVPMDECLARCVIDFGGRPFLVWRGLLKNAHKKISAEEKNQDASSAFRFGLAREFFQAFANEARCNLHLELLYGDEPHHIVEALFKAFARATDAACQRDPRMAGRLPSTKGKL
jgi:imidazoleglycerol-phosphate dehydratase